MLQSWGFWRRVLMFVAGVLALVPQFFALSPQWASVVAFIIAVISLALSFIPDSAVAQITELQV
jgi:VIT1/CCC1 family predicted Fe2+/Mn2+ transporter